MRVVGWRLIVQCPVAHRIYFEAMRTVAEQVREGVGRGPEISFGQHAMEFAHRPTEPGFQEFLDRAQYLVI